MPIIVLFRMDYISRMHNYSFSRIIKSIKSHIIFYLKLFVLFLFFDYILDLFPPVITISDQVIPNEWYLSDTRSIIYNNLFISHPWLIKWVIPDSLNESSLTHSMSHAWLIQWVMPDSLDESEMTHHPESFSWLIFLSQAFCIRWVSDLD